MPSFQAGKKARVAIAVFSTALVALLPLGVASGQSPATPKSTQAAPKISVAFSKVAMKALLTIERTNDKELVDAAMIELAGAGSNHTELSVAHDIAVFEAIYAIREMGRQSSLEAERAESEADLRYITTDPKSSHAHDGDYACVAAWLPRLRALSAVTPKQCPHKEP
jgi:hypothetical protein